MKGDYILEEKFFIHYKGCPARWCQHLKEHSSLKNGKIGPHTKFKFPNVSGSINMGRQTQKMRDSIQKITLLSSGRRRKGEREIGWTPNFICLAQSGRRIFFHGHKEGNPPYHSSWLSCEGGGGVIFRYSTYTIFAPFSIGSKTKNFLQF